MERTPANITILKSYLEIHQELKTNYVEGMDAFYTYGVDKYIYITWDKVVESYNCFINDLISIK
jgi:hypothetical protein